MLTVDKRSRRVNMTSTELEITAFWSYTHFDNKQDEKKIEGLCKRISGEVTMYIGKPFHIFLDVQQMRTGSKISDEIKKALNNSFLLITVLTPSYFQSNWCRFEYETFRERERILQRNDLILPIYYVAADEIDDPEKNSSNAWHSDLSSRNYFDWRDLRLQPKRAQNTMKAVSDLAMTIKNIIKSIHINNGEISTNKLQTINVESIDMEDYNDKIENIYLRLSQTQKYVIQTMYETLNRDEIPVDDLFKLLRDKHESCIENHVELLYRVKVLEYQGLVVTRQLGPKVTLVICMPQVGNALHRKGLIES
jgi:hypothetical protein